MSRRAEIFPGRARLPPSRDFFGSAGASPSQALFSAQQELRPPSGFFRLSRSFALPSAAVIGMFSTAARLCKGPQGGSPTLGLRFDHAYSSGKQLLIFQQTGTIAT